MYYRLLASHILPASLKRVLYLDPDILVINPLRPLWDLDLQGNVFAAASHIGVVDVMNGINPLPPEDGTGLLQLRCDAHGFRGCPCLGAARSHFPICP